MRRFSKIFAIFFAIALLVYVMCINAAAAKVISNSYHTLGGINFQTQGELTYSSIFVNGTTTAFRRDGGSTMVTVNIYVNVIVDYMTGSYTSVWDTEYGIEFTYNNQYENCSAPCVLDTTRTVNYVAGEHYSVNADDLDDNKVVSTYVDYTSLCSDFECVNTVILPGIDF